MEWFPWICILLQGVWCFYMGYRAGRDDNDDLSEEAQIEIKKYYWDHPKDGKAEEQIKTLLADNDRLREAYDAVHRELEYMIRERNEFQDLYAKLVHKYCTKSEQENCELPLTLEIANAENKEK